ncbi:MAG TPA: DUF948 domain-containing protein, partial [Chloroflexota bacterium]|nr:DUF948 domain-containing protein [Chloroflexota bacterium]
MKTRMKFLLATLLIVIAAGPAYPVDKEMLQLQKDVIDLVAQVKVMQTTMDSNNAMMKGLMEKMADQVNTLTSSVQKINQTVDGLKTQNDGTTKELRTILTNLNSTVGDLQENVTSIRSQMNSLANQVTSMKTTSEPLAKPDDLWRTAFADYNAGNYDLA